MNFKYKFVKIFDAFYIYFIDLLYIKKKKNIK